MRLSLNDKVVIVTQLDDGTEFHWNAAIYAKIKDLEVRSKGLFKETNDFIAWLEPEQRMAIEDYYRSVQAVLSRGMARHTTTNQEFVKIIKEITEKITRYTGTLFSVITMDVIQQWSASYNKIAIPDLGVGYNPIYKAEGTYDRDDYIKLVDLCIAYRIMVPVWCEYISLVGDVFASNKQEVNCLGLLRDATSIMESEAMQKLRDYVDDKSQLEMGKAATAIINGFSRSEISEWILAVTIVRRIGIGELSSNAEGQHLVTSIYGYIQGIINRDLDRKNAGRVREKFKSDSEGDEYERRSISEQYNTRQDITMGDASIFNKYIECYLHDAALQLVQYRDLDKEQTKDYLSKVDICVRYCSKLNELRLIDSQESVLGWIVNDIVPYKIIDRLTPDSKRKLLGIAQAYAWFFKIPDVAIALTALHDVELETNALINMPSARVSPNMHDRLAKLYHFSHPNMVEEGNEEEIRRNNVGVKALKEVIRGFNNGLFTARAPDELWETATAFQRSGCLVFKSISEQLVTLIETLNEV